MGKRIRFSNKTVGVQNRRRLAGAVSEAIKKKTVFFDFFAIKNIIRAMSNKIPLCCKKMITRPVEMPAAM